MESEAQKSFKETLSSQSHSQSPQQTHAAELRFHLAPSSRILFFSFLTRRLVLPQLFPSFSCSPHSLES